MWQKIRALRISRSLFFNLWFLVFGMLLPTQLGKHLWPPFAYLGGVRSDYLAPTFFLTDLLLVFYLPFFLTSPRFRHLACRYNPWQIALILILALNFFISPDKGLWLYRAWQYARIGLIAWYFALAKPAHWQLFLKGLTVAALYSLVLAVLQVFKGGSLQGAWYYLGERAFTLNTPGISTVSVNGQRLMRAYATFSHPNSLAGFFLAAAALGTLFKKPLLLYLSLPLVLLSFSKYAYVVLGALIIIWSIPNRCLVCRLGRWLTSVWLVFVTIFIQGNPDSLSIRLLSYRAHFNYLFTHPLGTGLGHYLYPLLPPRYQPVHNIYLLVLVELGLTILIFWPILPSLIKRIKDHSRLAAVIAVVFLTGLFDHYHLTLVQNMGMLGVVIALTSVYPPRQKTLN